MVQSPLVNSVCKVHRLFILETSSPTYLYTFSLTSLSAQCVQPENVAHRAEDKLHAKITPCLRGLAELCCYTLLAVFSFVFLLLLFHHIYMLVCFLFLATTSPIVSE